jgi:23S rRNA pseudouridine955/2504/2580 synthase
MRKITVQCEGPIAIKDWLRANYPMLTKTAVNAAFRDKNVKLNGKRASGEETIRGGDEVTLYIDGAKLDGPPLEVVWHSENIVVAVKQPGVSAKAEGEADMERLVGAWLEDQGETKLAIACHRLDNRTGGLLMLARSATAEAAVRAMMEAGKIAKTYNCIAKGVPEPRHAVLTAYLRKDAKKALVTVFDRPMPGARTAVTEYTVLKAVEDRSLLQVRLHTGRTHQIRAHLAHIGHPVLGDDKYGDREFNRQCKARRQKLWASRLDFEFKPMECPPLSDLAGKSLLSQAPFINELESGDCL